ncbi:unnamed protein product [Brachionus calyciflorus]|uniref:Uncharacterized protein n=1 Tax=Brachionus calyciflorus TaxID=104777 RepID=A0A814P5S4_9BILA|nr:unnamed protein product [Brachionus calyciflorus]
MQNLLNLIQSHKTELIIGSILTSALFLVKRKFRPNPKFESIKNLKVNNKVAIITGGNDGIGFETALDLAFRDAIVIIACRNATKSQEAVEKIKKFSKNENVFYEHLDLSSLDSVESFCKKIIQNYKQVDILINNAGIAQNPKQTTKDGFDLQLQTNYIGHYLLTRLLLDLLSQSPYGRIINVTSILYKSGRIRWDDINMNENYKPSEMYKESKLCLILFTNYLKEYYKKTNAKNVRAFSVSPGIVFTNLGRYRKGFGILKYIFYPLLWFLLKTPKQGAECSIYCAVKPDLTEKEGFMFRNCEQIELLPHAKNADDSLKLWNLTQDMLKEYHV